MCNLYSHRSDVQAIADLVGTLRNSTGNLPPQTGIFPDYPAPIVRTGDDGERELVMARLGMPSPPLVALAIICHAEVHNANSICAMLHNETKS